MKIVKGKVEKLQNEERTFFFGGGGVYQNGNFLPGKNISRREKIRKNDFAPSEKYACYAPAPVEDL